MYSPMKYKYLVYIPLLTVISCNKSEQKAKNSDSVTPEPSVALSSVQKGGEKEISWKGLLNGKTPVFMHYQLDGNLIAGEITYLNTKNKLPITILGTIEDDHSYRILEFEKSGNITGIITGKPTDGTFTGSWFSPKTKKNLYLTLSRRIQLSSQSRQKQNWTIFSGIIIISMAMPDIREIWKLKNYRIQKPFWNYIRYRGTCKKSCTDR